MRDLAKVFDAVVEDKIRTIPGKARLIETAKERGRLLAIRGRFDYVEKVVPYCYAAEKRLAGSSGPPPDIAGFDVVWVGCPGKLKRRRWEEPLRRLLAAGGILVTTDWGLTNLIQVLFPGTIERAGEASGTFPLRVRSPHHPLLEGIASCTGTPWMVEAASHRIGIRDPKRVEVILDAPQMGEPSAVLVAFGVGPGLVVHAISHFHLQGSEKSGEYVSAYLLTNVMDEAMRRKHPRPDALVESVVGSRVKVVASRAGVPTAGQPARIRVLPRD